MRLVSATSHTFAKSIIPQHFSVSAACSGMETHVLSHLTLVSCIKPTGAEAALKRLLV